MIELLAIYVISNTAFIGWVVYRDIQGLRRGDEQLQISRAHSVASVRRTERAIEVVTESRDYWRGRTLGGEEAAGEVFGAPAPDTGTEP